MNSPISGLTRLSERKFGDAEFQGLPSEGAVYQESSWTGPVLLPPGPQNTPELGIGEPVLPAAQPEQAILTGTRALMAGVSERRGAGPDPTQNATSLDIMGGASSARINGDGWHLGVPQFPHADAQTLRTIDTVGLDPAIGFVISGAALNDQAGYAVGRAGDFDGDGIDDFIVGALNGNGGTGAAYVIYGRAAATRESIDLANLSPDDGFVLNGDQSNDKAGNKVGFAGDVNGDGIDDIIIGARNGDEGGNNAGTAYVIYGREGGSGDIDLGALTAEQGFAVIGASNFSQFGYNVSTAGDVNGDGIDDIIVGALGGSTDGPNAGDSYVIYGQTGTRGAIDVTQLTESEGFLIRGIEPIRAGSVSGGGDINGDGIDDVIIGAHRGVIADPDAGEVYVVYGQAETRGTLDLQTFGESDGFIILGDAEKDYLGLSVAAAGDVNGDGIDDIIAGAFRGDDGGENAGEAYVIYGMTGPRGTVDLTGLSPTDGFIIQGDSEGDLAGLNVAAAGDVNGDGIDDVIVGARYGDDGGINAGEAYVIYGKTGDSRGTVDLTDLAPSDGFIIQGSADYDQAGRSVSAAGDVNGDGIDDLIIGAPAANELTGEAYVIYGFRNAPEATSDLPVTVAAVAEEPLALDLSSLVISDVDATGDMSVTLTATGGVLSAAAEAGVSVALSNASQTLTLTGSLEDLNAYLTTPGVVSFTGNADAAPDEAITVTIDDLDGSGLVEVGVIGVEIANRAPEATGLPASVEAVAGEPLALDLSSLVITDVDATGDMNVTLAATGGTLAAEAGAGVSVALSNASQTLTLTGSLGDLTSYLAAAGAVIYIGDPAAEAAEAISLAIDDLDGSGIVEIGAINVAIANRAPEGAGLPGSVEAVAGEPLALDLSTLTITDIDATGDMSVTLTASGGVLSAAAEAGVSVALSDASQTLTLTGSLEDLNAYLTTPGVVSFTGNADAAPEEAITVTIDDLDGSGEVEIGTIGIDITTPVPDPVIIAQGGGGGEIAGDSGDDILSATSGANVITGGDGDDLLGGGFDDDILFGGAGNDILFGDNSDFIAGADRIDGGTGDDLMEGGGGGDTFVFTTGDGADTIGRIALDYDDPALSVTDGADFVSGVDLVELSGFGLADGAAAIALVTDVAGVATFSFQGTTITFAGLTASDLDASDFLIL